MIPTPEQFRRYREEQRLIVKRIADCLRARVIPPTKWAIETIGRARANHTASIGRQVRVAS